MTEYLLDATALEKRIGELELELEHAREKNFSLGLLIFALVVSLFVALAT